MHCEACRERLGAHLDASLSSPERTEVKEHLAACPDCRRVAADLLALDDLLGLVPSEEPVPLELTDRILEATRIDADRARSASPGAIPAAAPITSSPIIGRDFATRRRVSQRPRRLRRLVWATAAAVLITAVLSWILTRPDGAGDDGLPLPPPGPRSVSARLHVNRTVGRLPADVTFRVYGPSVGGLFSDLTMLRLTPALSWNNLLLVHDAPYREVKADENGCFRLAEPLGTGAHLAYVTRPGYVGAWGLVEPSEETLDHEAVLYRATEIEVSGVIRDRESGAPIAGAMIASPDGTGNTLTDAHGEYRVTIAAVPGRRLRVFAFAPDHAAARAIVPATARESGDFRFDASLPEAARHDLAITLTDAAGEPVPGAQVLARPDLDDTNRSAVPRLRRDRPELAVTDENGQAKLIQLLPCRYRLEVRHDRLALTRERYADPRRDEPVNLEVAPAGDARVVVTVHDRAGQPAPDVRVVLTHTRTVGNVARPVQVRHTPTDFEGNARFADLRAGPAVVQVFTRDGIGRHLVILIERGDVVSFEYRLAAAPWKIRGALRDDLRGRYRLVRLEGTRPRMQAGRNPSLGHRLVVEVPVDQNGQFTFPPLPRLRNVVLMGRLSRDPELTPEALQCRPSLKEVFEKRGEEGDRVIEAWRQ